MLEQFVTYDQSLGLGPHERLLITGASGWFGRCALSLFRNSGSSLLAVGSQDKTIVLDGFKVPIYKQTLQRIREFNPTIIIDTAFITRDKLSSLGMDQFIGINRELMNDSLEMASLPSVRKYVGFSSGATVSLAGQASFSLLDNPYAALKREFEAGMTELSGTAKGKISIARVWSVTGANVTKPELFAFSNLISQARTGQMFIKAKNLVFRRYCTISEVISVALDDSGNHGPVFDTGGELIEIGELAEVIRQEINPKAEIVRDLREATEPDNYFSNGKVWDQLLNEIHIKPASIREQVRAVAQSLNK
jgi:nucleoside-diphosphate-sugar epimerase